MSVVGAARRIVSVFQAATALAQPAIMAGLLSVTIGISSGVGSAAAAPQGSAHPAEETPEQSEYRIGPGDVLQLFVWKELDISRELTVRYDGKVTIPLLGDVDASGRTPAQLAADVTKLFKRFLADPQVTVGVVNASSARFYVLGQVARPGDFPLRGRTTILQGLALAGGFKEFAKTDGIVIIRQDRGIFLPKGRPAETFITVNYKKLESGRDVSENIVLRPGDTILVP